MEKITIEKMPEVDFENLIHLKRYVKFINSRPERDLKVEQGFSRHHIIPKSLGGTDNNSNLLKLTNREHFIAHLVLWKCEFVEMSRAFWLMTHDSSYANVLTSKQYARLKNELSLVKQIVPEKFSFSGWHHTEEAKQLISSKLSGANSPHYGKPITEEHRLNLRLSHLGQTPWNKGIKRTKEQNVAFEKPLIGLSRLGVFRVQSCTEAKNLGSPTAAVSSKSFGKSSGRDAKNNKIYWFFTEDLINNTDVIFKNEKRKNILLGLFKTEEGAKKAIITLLQN